MYLYSSVFCSSLTPFFFQSSSFGNAAPSSVFLHFSLLSHFLPYITFFTYIFVFLCLFFIVFFLLSFLTYLLLSFWIKQCSPPSSLLFFFALSFPFFSPFSDIDSSLFSPFPSSKPFRLRLCLFSPCQLHFPLFCFLCFFFTPFLHALLLYATFTRSYPVLCFPFCLLCLSCLSVQLFSFHFYQHFPLSYLALPLPHFSKLLLIFTYPAPLFRQ